MILNIAYMLIYHQYIEMIMSQLGRGWMSWINQCVLGVGPKALEPHIPTGAAVECLATKPS